MTTTNDERGRIFTDASAYADPVAWHAAAKKLRAEAPVLRVELPDYPAFWAFTKHADVMEIERNPRVFTNSPMPTLTPKAQMRPSDEPAAVQTLIQMDGDNHRDHRKIVNDWFMPASINRMQDRVAELAKRYVDEMASLGGRCDFARDIAMHYPLHVILSTLGLPEDDYGRMLQLTQELFGGDDPDIGRVGNDEGSMAIIMDFVQYFNGVAADRRANPTSDLASVIANAELNGAPLPDVDVLGFYLITATAGHDTTTNSIAGGLHALLTNPDQLELLRANPDLLDDHAVEELIRYVTPVKHFMRTCQEPFTIRGTEIQPGELVLMSYASANRDDEVFTDPDRLDLNRENASGHLAFGFGRHFCLGAHLARLEIRTFFRELLGRLESIELDGETTFTHSTLVTGPKNLPIRYSLRS
jgi:cytochrome P450